MKIKLLNWWKYYNKNITVIRIGYGGNTFCLTILNFSLYFEKKEGINISIK